MRSYLASTASLAATLALVTSSLAAQEIVARRYSELDGLPSSHVRDIVESPAGTLWFATRAGLHEYDGTSWQPALPTLLPTGRDVAFVRFDQTGSPWVLCADGTVLSATPPEPLSIPSIEADRLAGFLFDFEVIAAPEKPPLLAVATSNRGLLVCRGQQWSSPDLGGAERATLAVEAWHGHILCGTSDGLHAIGDEREPDLAWLDEVPPGPVRGLAADREADGGRLWILGVGWLGTVSDERFTLLTSGIPPLYTPDASGVALTSDGHGGALYGNTLAIYHINGRDLSVRRLGEDQGLGVDGVNRLLRDRNGLIWGASSLGAFKIIRLDATTYTARDGLLDSEVSALAQFPDGRIVMGHQGGLTIDAAGERQTHRFVGYDPELPAASRVMDLCIDRDGGLVIAAAGRGVGRLLPDQTVAWTRIPEAAGGWVNAVRTERDGAILVGTTKGLYRWQNGFQPVGADQLDQPFVRRIALARDGTIYLATPLGIWIGRGRDWRRAGRPAAPSGFEHMFTCLQDHAGRVWCGGSDGLWQLEGDMLVRPGPAFEVLRPVYSLTEDGQHRLWIGTDLGFEYSDGERVRQLSWMVPQTGREANRAAALVDDQDRVWLGSNRGVTVFEPSFAVAPPPPSIELLAIRVGPDSLVLDRPIEIDAGFADLRFHVRALSYFVEDQVEFRYRMAGLGGWETTVNPTVLEQRYSGLPPGRFAFEVQARAPGGDFSAILRSPEVVVLGPVWQRWWFMLLVVMASGLIGVIAYRAMSLRTHAARLEHEVSLRTRELEVSLRELAKTDRLRSLGLVGGGIAHDLRNVLTVLSGNLALLQTERGSPFEREAALQSADAALDRANQLAAQLQTFATGGAPVRRETSLAEIVRDSVAFVTAGASLEIDVACADGLWSVAADPVQIRQVIENLLVNARQCQPDGGTIRIVGQNVELPGADDRRSTSAGLPAGRYVAFTISDEGPGVPAAIAHRIFDPFFTTKDAGTGLGLATALSIVRRHGGSLTLEPSTRGATFRLLLPVADAETTAAATEVKAPAAPAARLSRVLVVDDEAAICRVLCQLLAVLGYEADSAPSSEAAVALTQAARAAGTPFELAIIDLTLPGDLPGHQILDRLRQLEPDLQAVATSGYASGTVMSHYRAHGFQGVLPKPYRLDDLRSVMSELPQRRAAEPPT